MNIWLWFVVNLVVIVSVIDWCLVNWYFCLFFVCDKNGNMEEYIDGLC